MREVKEYEADDGSKRFSTPEECREYELRQAEERRALAWWETLPEEGRGKKTPAKLTAVKNFLAWEREQGGGAEAAE